MNPSSAMALVSSMPGLFFLGFFRLGNGVVFGGATGEQSLRRWQLPVGHSIIFWFFS